MKIKTTTSKINSQFGVKIERLTKSNLLELEEIEVSVEYGDLYQALHHVGDDPVKQSIEEALVQILDPDDFRKVVAVFKAATQE